MAMTAAIDENRSTHCEISVMGGRPGSGGRPGMWSDVASAVTSDISTSSKSRIFLVTSADSDAAGLNGPG